MITTKQTKTFFLIVKFQEQWTNNLNNNIYTINYTYKGLTESFNSVLKIRIDADMRSISF